MQGWSEVPRELPLFESILVFENYPVPVETAAREEAESVEVGDVQTSENTHYPLTVEVAGSTRLLLRVGYDCRRFDDETVVRILSHFETLLSQMAARPDRRLRDLEYLPEAEKSLVLEGWNQTATDDRLDVVFNQLFEEQAARTPASVAVWCEGQSLTYEELNRRADAVAAYLSNAGVGPDSVVGLLAERGSNSSPP